MESKLIRFRSRRGFRPFSVTPAQPATTIAREVDTAAIIDEALRLEKEQRARSRAEIRKRHDEWERRQARARLQAIRAAGGA